VPTLISDFLLSPVCLQLYGVWNQALPLGERAADYEELHGPIWQRLQLHTLEILPDPDGTLRFLRVGSAVVRAVGRDVSGLKLTDAYGDDADRFLDFNRTVIGGQVLLAQERSRVAGRDTLWFEVLALPVNFSGVRGVVSTAVIVAVDRAGKPNQHLQEDRVVRLVRSGNSGQDWVAEPLHGWEQARARVSGELA
jgi:hypothetical protein